MKRLIAITAVALLTLSLSAGTTAEARGKPEPSVPYLRPVIKDCSPPKYLEKGLDQLRLDPNISGGPVHIAAGETSIEDCKKELLTSKKSCRIGDIIVVNGEGTVYQAGRCDRDPKGTKAYRISNAYLNLALNQPAKQVSGYDKRVQTLVTASTFKMTQGSTAVGTPGGCPLAWHTELRNSRGQIMNIQGVGRKYNPGANGINGLHALVNFWSIQDWTDEEWVNRTDVKPLNILTHETEHDVCCFITHLEKDSSGVTKVSSALIGHQGAHWSLYHNTYGQLMYGANWRDEGNGTWYSIKPARGMRPLDLYLWGLMPPSSVKPVFRIDTTKKKCTATAKTLAAIAKDCADKKNNYPCKTNTDCTNGGLCPGGTVVSPEKVCTGDTDCASGDFCTVATLGASKGKKVCHKQGICSIALTKFDLCLEPPYYRTTGGGCTAYDNAVVQSPERLRIKGVKTWTSLNDILGAVGPRIPDYTKSYKNNTQLFVLLTGGGVNVTKEAVETYDRFRRDFSRHIYWSTGYRLRNTNTWDGADDTGLWEWGGVEAWQGDDELEGWSGVNLETKLAVIKDGGKVRLYLKDATSGITHSNLRLKGTLYDALQVKLTVPVPDSGPKLYHGKIILDDGTAKTELAFPVYADGKEHAVVIHPPHKMLEKWTAASLEDMKKKQDKQTKKDWAKISGTEWTKTCKQGCTAICKSTEDEELDAKKETTWEEWRDSCTGELLKVTATKRACTSSKLRTACGPYCSGPKDPVLGTTAKEGWYDSCNTKLTGSYTSLTVIPVAHADAAKLTVYDPKDPTKDKPLLIDRVDLFRAAKELTEDRLIKDGEKDWDGDGLINAYDNCPKVSNPRQIDGNDDEHGDACDDFDSDGTANALDNCPTMINSQQRDEDEDGIGDVCDPDFSEGCAVSSSGGSTAWTGAGMLAMFLLVTLARRRRRG